MKLKSASKLEEQIIEALRKKRKDILTSFDSSHLPIEIYAKIAKIGNLKQIFQNLNDPNLINEALKKEIISHFNNSDQILKEMNQAIESDYKNSINSKEIAIWGDNLLESIQYFTKYHSNLMDKINIVQSSFYKQHFKQTIFKQQSPTLHKQVISFVNVYDHFQNAHFDTPLQNELKYKINFEILSYYKACSQRIALITDLDAQWKDNEDISQFINRFPQQNLKRIIVGEDIWDQNYYVKNNQIGKEIRRVELRICIKEKIFEVFDYPSYRNGISIDASSLDDDLKYHLGLFSCNEKDTITLEDINIVDTF